MHFSDKSLEFVTVYGYETLFLIFVSQSKMVLTFEVRFSEETQFSISLFPCQFLFKRNLVPLVYCHGNIQFLLDEI